MSQYRRGHRVELKAIKVLEQQGYTAIRSAGSKKIDIIALIRGEQSRETQPLIRAIMVTINNTSQKIKKDFEYLESFKLPSIVSQEVWLYSRGKFSILKKKNKDE